MKTLVNISFLAILLFSCKDAPKNTPVIEASKEVISDSMAVTNTIRGFYKWYKDFVVDTTKHMDFADDSGKHYKLNTSKLERYYAHFKVTGFVSNEFIENEYAFYKKCNTLWQDEPVDDVPSCLDADKYYCAQDWDDNIWLNSPIKITKTNGDRASATLYYKDQAYSMERNFELKKENGKWVLAKIECDMGID